MEKAQFVPPAVKRYNAITEDNQRGLPPKKRYQTLKKVPAEPKRFVPNQEMMKQDSKTDDETSPPPAFQTIEEVARGKIKPGAILLGNVHCLGGERSMAVRLSKSRFGVRLAAGKFTEETLPNGETRYRRNQTISLTIDELNTLLEKIPKIQADFLKIADRVMI